MYFYRCARQSVRAPITVTYYTIAYIWPEASEVDNEAVSYVGLQHTLIRFVDLLNGDDLDVSGDAMIAAEVQHLLRFADAADRRTGQPPAHP